MECPVCKHKKVEVDALNCPKCQSNLQGFRALESIEKERNRWKKIIYFLCFLVVILLLAWSFSNPKSGDELLESETNSQFLDSLTKQKTMIEDLTSELQKMDSVNFLLSEQIESFDVVAISKDGESEEKSYHVHIVKKGETLWSIAEEYHSDGFRHEEIAGHNELNDPHYITVGDTVIIKK